MKWLGCCCIFIHLLQLTVMMVSMFTLLLETLHFEPYPDKLRSFLIAFSLRGAKSCRKADTARRIFCCLCCSKIIAKEYYGAYVFLNSNFFVFKVRLVKFCTDIIWDKINIFRPKKSGSNQQRLYYDVIFALLKIENC